MNICNVCNVCVVSRASLYGGGTTFCVSEYIGYLPIGEKMIKLLRHKNYEFVMQKLHTNPHLLLYNGGKYKRNILRHAIFEAVECQKNYSFIQDLLDFGKAHLSLEMYNKWINLETVSVTPNTTKSYYKYPIEKKDIKMIKLLLANNIPYPYHVILLCVSGSKYSSAFDLNTYIEVLSLFLAKGADTNGCLSHKLIADDYNNFTISTIMQLPDFYYHDFRPILDLLFIFGVNFDYGRDFVPQEMFENYDEYHANYLFYTCISLEEKQKHIIWWLSYSMHEVISLGQYLTSCHNFVLKIDSPVVTNITHIILLYFSQSFNIDLVFADLANSADLVNLADLVNSADLADFAKFVQKFIFQFIQSENKKPHFWRSCDNSMNDVIDNLHKKLPFFIFIKNNIRELQRLGHIFTYKDIFNQIVLFL
jgi:hypothetical protein